MPTMNAIFTYVKLQQPDFKYGSKTEKEFSVDCIVDKATAKQWNKDFQKQRCKEVDREDFERIYKIAPPTDAEEFYVIKLKRAAQYRDGTPIPDAMRPRAFKPGANGKLQDITKDILIANGSSGVVSYDVRENEFGRFASLKAIRVNELIEYKKAGSGNSFDELGEVESLTTDFSDVPERQMSEAQEAAHAKAEKPKQKVEDSFEDPLDDDIPFNRISDKLLLII